MGKDSGEWARLAEAVATCTFTVAEHKQVAVEHIDRAVADSPVVLTKEPTALALVEAAHRKAGQTDLECFRCWMFGSTVDYQSVCCPYLAVGLK